MLHAKGDERKAGLVCFSRRLRCDPSCTPEPLMQPLLVCPCREVEFIQKEDAERRRLEEAEKAHLAEIQGLQVRVRHISHLRPPLCSGGSVHLHLSACELGTGRWTRVFATASRFIFILAFSAQIFSVKVIQLSIGPSSTPLRLMRRHVAWVSCGSRTGRYVIFTGRQMLNL